MSTFRDRVHNELVTVARHPRDVHAILGVLQDALREKAYAALEDHDDSFADGLQEAWAFVANLRADVAREYGYKESEGKDNGIV